MGGLAIGADGAIGGTYALMPEAYIAIYKLVQEGRILEARDLQYDADAIIYKICEAKGNLYAIIKKVLLLRENLHLGSVRKPLAPVNRTDDQIVYETQKMVDAIIAKANAIKF